MQREQKIIYQLKALNPNQNPQAKINQYYQQLEQNHIFHSHLKSIKAKTIKRAAIKIQQAYRAYMQHKVSAKLQIIYQFISIKIIKKRKFNIQIKKIKSHLALSIFNQKLIHLAKKARIKIQYQHKKYHSTFIRIIKKYITIIKPLLQSKIQLRKILLKTQFMIKCFNKRFFNSTIHDMLIVSEEQKFQIKVIETEQEFIQQLKNQEKMFFEKSLKDYLNNLSFFMKGRNKISDWIQQRNDFGEQYWLNTKTMEVSDMNPILQCLEKNSEQIENRGRNEFNKKMEYLEISLGRLQNLRWQLLERGREKIELSKYEEFLKRILKFIQTWLRTKLIK